MDEKKATTVRVNTERIRITIERRVDGFSLEDRGEIYFTSVEGSAVVTDEALLLDYEFGGSDYNGNSIRGTLKQVPSTLGEIELLRRAFAVPPSPKDHGSK